MFDKILIANRGEIACRVMETARAMGVKTVAVYSDADAASKHVALADQAVHIGGAAPAESYLRGDMIIQAALDTGARAIHPGYGFLSENPDFVDAVEAAGLTFIGPSAEAIRAMGLKDAAKALMQEAGVPVVPGYHGDNQDAAFLAEQAQEIGYPVLIKAVAGGGGKGMRLVEVPSEFAAALASAQGEAQTAFGNPDVLIEKYIQQPRHIEVQVFGDGTDAVHLFERDCSLQRRHQKVIEEAPAPDMPEEVRDVMGEAAVRAAKAIGYKGAGTVEFIVDGSDGLRTDGFWFMEMNTRLQVEHPVTELITGVDLVAWQLRVASGEPIPLRQEDLTIKGHSFEARLYAEDVPKGFLPATGTLTHLTFPEGCRADSGVRAGDTISPFYDPMIAKVIVHGASRDVALAKMRDALSGCEVAGTVTNLAFLGALCAHDGFGAGEVDTGLIARDLETLTMTKTLAPEIIAEAALAVSGVLERGRDVMGFSLWDPLQHSVYLKREDVVITSKIAIVSPDEIAIDVEGVTVTVRRAQSGWRIGDRTLSSVALTEETVTVFADYGVSFDRVDPLQQDSDTAAAGNLIEAPMPGLVKAIYVSAGDQVAAGDRLAILEAMKMEHALLAARDGEVAEVLAEAGSQVEAGMGLIQLTEEAAP